MTKKNWIEQSNLKFLGEIPFDSDRKMMTVAYSSQQNLNQVLKAEKSSKKGKILFYFFNFNPFFIFFIIFRS
jgi:magnesium-transporting ATPase (P-type)